MRPYSYCITVTHTHTPAGNPHLALIKLRRRSAETKKRAETIPLENADAGWVQWCCTCVCVYVGERHNSLLSGLGAEEQLPR